MKYKLSIILILSSLLFSCNTSRLSKKELLKENQALKTKIEALKVSDNSKLEAVLETINLNIVYRGVSNPIKISFPNAIDIKAVGVGLSKKEGIGNYLMIPGSGKTVDITIKAKMIDGSIITDVKTLRIKNIGRLVAKINNIGGCGSKCEILLSKKELVNSKISVEALGVQFDWKFEIKSFKIHLPNKKSIKVESNKIPKSFDNNLKDCAVGDIVQIFDIKASSNAGIRAKNPSPIIIKIIE